MDSDIAPILPEGSVFSIPDNHARDRVAGAEAYAVDPEAARRLWEVSERMTGVRFEAE